MTRKTTRKSSGTYRDKKGRTPVKVGTRKSKRVFTFNKSWSLDEVDRVRNQLKEVYEAFGEWNDLANAIADSLKNRINPVPVPAPDVHEPTAESLVHWRMHLARRMPSVPFESLREEQFAILRERELRALQASADKLASIDERPATKAIATKGTLHEAMRKYEEYVQADQPTNFDRHAKIKQLIERSKDIPLATLDIAQCRILIDYWRSRPERHDKKGSYSAKRSREQLAELDLFFRHTHTFTDYAWRMPEDLELLKRTVKSDEKKNLSFIPIKLFTIEELKALISSGSLIQRLITTWCLNCSHGAAELGRVTWGDLYLNQDHPWRSQGLQVESGGHWTGFLRHKTDVVGWWQLWPETVALIEQWRLEAERLLGRKVQDTDRLILTQSGESMYKDSSKNAQSKFAKEFNEVRTLANVSALPLGTLRKQLSDWIGTAKGDTVAASIALAHGIPHKADKLLFAHYNNRPWAKLFEHQREFRSLFF